MPESPAVSSLTASRISQAGTVTVMSSRNASTIPLPCCGITLTGINRSEHKKMPWFFCTFALGKSKFPIQRSKTLNLRSRTQAHQQLCRSRWCDVKATCASSRLKSHIGHSRNSNMSARARRMNLQGQSWALKLPTVCFPHSVNMSTTSSPTQPNPSAVLPYSLLPSEIRMVKKH